MVSEVTELALEDDFFENRPMLCVVVLFIELVVGYRCRHETDKLSWPIDNAGEGGLMAAGSDKREVTLARKLLTGRDGYFCDYRHRAFGGLFGPTFFRWVICDRR
jgi:hypothetical protein